MSFYLIHIKIDTVRICPGIGIVMVLAVVATPISHSHLERAGSKFESTYRGPSRSYSACLMRQALAGGAHYSVSLVCIPVTGHVGSVGLR